METHDQLELTKKKKFFFVIFGGINAILCLNWRATNLTVEFEVDANNKTTKPKVIVYLSLESVNRGRIFVHFRLQLRRL